MDNPCQLCDANHKNLSSFCRKLSRAFCQLGAIGSQAAASKINRARTDSDHDLGSAQSAFLLNLGWDLERRSG